jgi:exopolysaccharide biosynthesis WecB/TagA/CpsF family protein
MLPDRPISPASDASAADLMSAPLPTRLLLGLSFTDASLPDVAGRLAARPASAGFGYVVTPNADHLVRLSRTPGLLPIYQRALMRVLDSRVVARLAWLLGLPPPHVVTGSDLTACLLTEHLAPGERVTIIGLRPDLLPALTARIGLAPPAHHYPPFGFDRDPASFDAAVRFALAHPARYTFLAVGSPRQEKLAAAIAATGQATGLGLCIGASLEFLAGAQRRAPEWMQGASLEWLHRLAQDPRRLARRYLIDSPAVVRLLARQRFARASAAQDRTCPPVA